MQFNYKSSRETYDDGHKYHLESECQKCHKTKEITVNGGDLFKYHNGQGYIQDIFPYLSAADRELLFISGICGDCFDEMFKED